MNHGPLVAVVALVVVALVGGPALTAPGPAAGTPTPLVGTVGAQQSGSTAVSISNVTVSPEEPIAGNTFLIEATVRNHEGATTAYEMTEVYVDKPEERSYIAEEPGTLTPGSSTRVTIPVSIEDPGQYTLSVRVNGVETDGSAVVTANHPAPVRVVEEQQPRLNLVGADWEAGAESTATVAIANGAADPIGNLELTVNGTSMRIDSPTRVRASLAAESNVSYEFDVTPRETGSGRLTARLRYTDPAGNDRSVTVDRTVSVAERDPPLALALSADPVGPSGETDFEVTAVNERQDAITGLELRFESSDGQMVDSTTVIPTLQSGNETTETLDAQEVQSGPHELTVRASYTAEDGEQATFTETLRTTVPAIEEPGNVSLSELQIRGTTGTIRVQGSVSNPGTTDVSGVEISVLEGERVGPAPSQSTFFVGNVTSSDFTNFQVNAQLRTDTNRTVTIPLEASYIVDGVRRERVIEVDYRPRSRPEQARMRRPGGGGGLPLVPIAAVLIVGGLGLYGWRRYRG